MRRGCVVHEVRDRETLPTLSDAVTFTHTVLPKNTCSVRAVRVVWRYSVCVSRSSPWNPMPVESIGNSSTVTS